VYSLKLKCAKNIAFCPLDFLDNAVEYYIRPLHGP
jgi:hypothetical protein